MEVIGRVEFGTETESDAAPRAIVVVPALRSEVDRCLDENILDLLGGEVGVGLEHQGDAARGVRAGHRRAAHARISGAHARRCGVHAGCGDRRLELARRVGPIAPGVGP